MSSGLHPNLLFREFLQIQLWNSSWFEHKVKVSAASVWREETSRFVLLRWGKAFIMDLLPRILTAWWLPPGHYLVASEMDLWLQSLLHVRSAYIPGNMLMGELSTEAEGSVSSPFSLQEVAQPRALAEKPVAAHFGVCKSVSLQGNW